MLAGVMLAGCKQDEPGRDDPQDNPSMHRDLDYLFDMRSVPHITLTLTEADWNTYLRNYDKNSQNSEYVPAAFSFTKDGETYTRDSVGLRPRGNTSRVRPESRTGKMHEDGAQFHRAHFGIRFTNYETGQRFFGVDRLILKRNKDDPTYCHEVFSYDLFHRFGVWSAPRASYCRLTIYIQGDTKPVYMGVYSMIENPRKGWLDSRYHAGNIPDKKGNMWKAVFGANLSEVNMSKMGISDDESSNSFCYSLKTNKSDLASAQAELCDFINGLINHAPGSPELKSWLEEHIDVDLLLRTYAVNVMVGSWDDYWKNTNNYLFYFDSNHRFYFIPYDYDNTLGTAMEVERMPGYTPPPPGVELPDYGNPGTADMLRWGKEDKLLMSRVLSIESYMETYKSYIKQIATSSDLMSPDAAKIRVQEIQALIGPYVANDTESEASSTITDKPASWSTCPKYRLLSGGVGDGITSESNFFDTKVASIYW